MKINFLKIGVFSLLVLFILTTLISCSANYSQNENANNDDGTGYFNDNEVERNKTNESNFDPGRKFIYTSSLKIETKEYQKSITALESLINDFGGFIQDSRVENQTQTSGYYSLRKATYTVRIPSEKRIEFLSASGDVGTIVLNQTKGDDVTDKFFDSQARLEAFKTQEERLLELLSKATNLAEILDIEDRLSKVRYEIESLSGTINKLSSLVSLSTVNIEIMEVRELSEPDPETFGEEIVKTFNSSINALLTTLRYATLAVVALLPFLTVLFIFIIIIILLLKKGRRRKGKKNDGEV